MNAPAERMTCPRRLNTVGPWQREELADFWRVCWTPGEVSTASSRHYTNDQGERVNEVLSTHIGWLQAWPEPPLTCSFCGCSRPSDVFRLLEASWEIDRTDKRYKFYLQPLGHRAAVRELLLEGPKRRKFPSTPVPPIKVYTWHFTPKEIERLNTWPAP